MGARCRTLGRHHEVRNSRAVVALGDGGSVRAGKRGVGTSPTTTVRSAFEDRCPHGVTVHNGGVIEQVREWLGYPVETLDRIERLERFVPVPGDFVLPPPDEMLALMKRLDVPIQAFDEVISSAPTPDSAPEAWWILERLYAELAAEAPVDAVLWPTPMWTDAPLGRFLHLYVFLAAVARVRKLHDARGIPDDISWGSLGDLGLQVDRYRREYGICGFNTAFWMTDHFRGRIFRLGRLQYEFATIDFDPSPDDPLERGAPILGVHIPALGPLDPTACDLSLKEASVFFPRYFPERPVRYGTCASWLLDEQLMDYLPPDSNIMRFQERFTHFADWSRPGDDDVVRFVFGQLPPSLEELPRDSTLQRAVLDHLGAGKHWRIRQGWLEI